MRALYPPDWRELTLKLKEQAGWQCECRGECGRGHTDRCPERHGQLALRGRRDHLIVLTVGHRDHDPRNNRRSNLGVWCQGCHLHHDLEHHWETRIRLEYLALERAGQLTLTLD